MRGESSALGDVHSVRREGAAVAHEDGTASHFKPAVHQVDILEVQPPSESYVKVAGEALSIESGAMPLAADGHAGLVCSHLKATKAEVRALRQVKQSRGLWVAQ